MGIENFEKMRTEGFYYIDKTGFIKELLENWGEVNLFTPAKSMALTPFRVIDITGNFPMYFSQ